MPDPAYDGFQILAQMAGVTNSIRLATNICVAPIRHPVTLAKHGLTLHSISGGRFDFGVGVGWLEEEFDVLDIPFDERGSRTDEFLEIFNRACSEEEFAHEGRHYEFQRTGFHPVSGDLGPSIYIGGESGAALRRTAEYGDGWSQYWTRDDLSESSPEGVSDWRRRLMTAWEDYDRDGEPEVAVTRPVRVDNDPQPPFHSELGVDRSLSDDVPLLGTPESIVRDIKNYASAGVNRLNCSFQVHEFDIDLFIDQMEKFGEEVIPRL
jgi:alkanesulfonate monooxygenase SsuD/methylene tetrahydromethanopterin reductase-like flavin-dependent oxidoreductase (luciferase family)